jgi:aminopeptidase N
LFCSHEFQIEKIMLKQHLAALVLVLLGFPTAAFTQTSDSTRKIPALYVARPQKIDVKHSVLNLQFDWQKKQAFGTASITLSPLTSTNKISLDAAMLTIHSVSSVSGLQLKFAYDESDKDDNLLISLDRIYQPGEKLTIKINYHTNWINRTDPNNLGGSNGKGIRFFEPSFTDPKKRRQIWSMAGFESNRYWFPCNDSPNDLRTTELTATVDKKLTTISNGVLVKTTDNSNGTHTFHWKMDTPYANYQTSFVIGEYVDVHQKFENITMHSFGYPDEKEAVEATVVRLPDMMKFYSGKIGVKYPYSTYAQVFVQELPWGMAGIGTSTQTENMIDDFRTHADYFYLWDGLEAEALAQQWFGGYITCKDWSDTWLNKSFAHYFDGLYTEYKNGKDEFYLWNRVFDINTYHGDWSSGYRHPIVTKHFDDAATFVSDNYSYSRGALVLHTLRKQLGEVNWWKSIQHYVRKNGGGLATTEDFQKAIEEATGDSISWFFEQWIYKMGHPVFRVTKKYNPAKQNLDITITQTQKIDSTNEYPQVQYFKGKMEIEIDGRIEEVWIEAKEENLFTFHSKQEPRLVDVDFESAWIKEIKFEKSLNELLYQLQNDKDVLGKRWAMSELVSLAKSEKISAADQARIYDGFRSIILGNSYWRIRYIALLQFQSLLAPATSTGPAKLDRETITMLQKIIKNEKAWLRTAAISFLGTTRDAKYADTYLSCFNDSSERVINAAAIALGKSKSEKAFNALVKLKNKPSWKNQSLISTLNGLKELGDPRGSDIALNALADLYSSRWTLATPIWDFRIAAAETLAALGKGNAGYPIILERFNKSMAENDVSDIFNNVLLITRLADPRGEAVFDELKKKFKDDANAMVAVDQFETQLREALKK